MRDSDDEESNDNNLSTESAGVGKSGILVKKRFKNFSEKYDRGQFLRKGAFGQIFECSQKDSQGEDKEQKKALKVLKKNLLSQKPALDDLLVNEFKILMDTKHPHIVRMYDIFQDRMHFYVVQERFDGSDLYQTLKYRSYTEDESSQIIKQTLLALKFLHDQNIVHRDIKSDNLYALTDDENPNPGQITVKLTDFGLAARIDTEIGGLKGFAGTPEYMPPEVVLQPGNKAFPQKPDPTNAHIITQKSDIFAVGVLTYEILTGHTAFSFACKSPIRLYNAILRKEPQFKEVVFQYCTEDCIDFIKLCLTKDMEARPSTDELLKHPWLCSPTDQMLGSSVANSEVVKNTSFRASV